MPRAPLVNTALTALALLGVTASPAGADVVGSTDTLRIEFTVAGNYSLVPDMMVLNFGLVTVTQPYTARIAQLYNGSTLLATATDPLFSGYVGPLSLNPGNSWRDPSSPWTFDSPADTDFSSIQNGSIQGRIDWHPEGGAIDVVLGQMSLQLGRAEGPASWSEVFPAPVISSIQIISACAADYDHNGSVEPADIAAFVNAWFTSLALGSLVGDLDGNGQVEPADIALFVSRWFAALGGSCSP